MGETSRVTKRRLQRFFENGLKRIRNNQADEYSETKTYAVGDYCIYNNTLYKCTKAVSTAGPFTASSWKQTTVASEIDSLYTNLSGKQSTIKVMQISASAVANSRTPIISGLTNFAAIPVDYGSIEGTIIDTSLVAIHDDSTGGSSVATDIFLSGLSRDGYKITRIGLWTTTNKTLRAVINVLYT